MKKIMEKREGQIKDKLYGIYNSNHFSCVLFLLYFLLTILIYIEYPLKKTVPVTGDGLLIVNMFNYIKDLVSEGELPLWNSLLSNGVSSVADVTRMTFYPLKYLALILKEEWIFPVFYALHIALGAVFFYKYLVLIACKKYIAVFTSLLYLFSIHLGGIRKEHITLIACLIYLPIILFFIEKYVQSGKRKYLLYSSICMALQFFIGFPQYMVYTDLTAGIYLIASAAYRKYPIKKWFKDACVWGTSYLGLILVQLLPFMELSQYYLSAGAKDTSFEVFKSYSLHPLRYIMMLYPQMFENQPWENTVQLESSGFDIEIFLGTFVAVILLYGVTHYLYDIRVKGAAIAMLITGLYASSGCIGIISKILFKIPLISSFRASSRILFIFLFFAYTIFAVSLSKLTSEKEVKDILRLVQKLACVSLGLMIVQSVWVMTAGNEGTTVQNVIDIYGLPIALFLLLIVGCKIVIGRKNFSVSICLFIAVFSFINVAEVYPYWREDSVTELQEIRINSDIERQLAGDAEGYKVLTASPVIWGEYPSMLKYNRNLSMKVSSINSYMNINNPRLSKLMTSESILQPAYNDSGLYTGFLQIKKNLYCQNDLLSMLGVKYIIDPEKILDDSQSIYSKGIIETEELFHAENIEIGGTDQALCVPVYIEPEKFYEASFQVDGSFEGILTGNLQGELFRDSNEQVFSNEIVPQVNDYTITLFSGDLEKSFDGYFVAWLPENTENLNIKNLTISKYSSIKEEAYSLYYADDTMSIYENQNVCPVLYFPEYVERIEDDVQVYNDPVGKNLKEVSYCADIEAGYKNDLSNAGITNIKQKANRVTADITAENKVFLNFSQNHCPGWNAFIDGEKTELYEVNGLIQGIEVPEGEHEVCFVYNPVMLYVGVVGSLLTLLIIILLIKKENHSMLVPKEN